jgi:hypothetical protein
MNIEDLPPEAKQHLAEQILKLRKGTVTVEAEDIARAEQDA